MEDIIKKFNFITASEDEFDSFEDKTSDLAENIDLKTMVSVVDILHSKVTVPDFPEEGTPGEKAASHILDKIRYPME